ncbi:hypothetical protein ABG768_020314 [Culter alburnus]|uniref:Uncharacterized protein n=1 Tax=Culter alburnus TaxID=194366 RepID=A0AAW2B0Y1_CULAL
MPLEKDFLKKSLEFLKGKPVFTSFPLSLLLIGLEKLIEVEFLCPCRLEMNAGLTTSVFIGPALFTFILIFLLLRPFKYKYSGCCAEPNDDTHPNPSDVQPNPSDVQPNPSNVQPNPSDIEQNSSNNERNPSDDQQNCPKALAYCLIPPVMWIFILLIDGEYVACGMTDWNGVYVLDEELNRFWCKPTEKIHNETELRDLTRKYIYQSQCIVMLRHKCRKQNQTKHKVQNQTKSKSQSSKVPKVPPCLYERSLFKGAPEALVTGVSNRLPICGNGYRAAIPKTTSRGRHTPPHKTGTPTKFPVTKHQKTKQSNSKQYLIQDQRQLLKISKRNHKLNLEDYTASGARDSTSATTFSEPRTCRMSKQKDCKNRPTSDSDTAKNLKRLMDYDPYI